MQKQNFVSVILGTLGGVIFALGMCMAILPEWDAVGLPRSLRVISTHCVGVTYC
jgi:hypothetical protein